MFDTKFGHKLEFFGQRVLEIYPFEVDHLPKNGHIGLFWAPWDTEAKFSCSSIDYSFPRHRPSKKFGIQGIPATVSNSKNKKNSQKMAKNDLKLSIFWQFFNFFQKILVLMPPKLLCIFWPFVPTYSQSSSHLETILGQKMAKKWPKMT